MPKHPLSRPTLELEIAYGRDKGNIVIGTDEAGRGPLAGPVVAAAVIIPADFPDEIASAIHDSKKLSEKKREELFPLITTHCPHGIAECSAQEIDDINILQASLLAMQRSTLALKEKSFAVAGFRGCEDFSLFPNSATSQPRDYVTLLVDGNKAPKIPDMNIVTVVKGDSKSLSIAAASILAKVTRDHIMQQLHRHFPVYGWDHNAGYPTADHLAALATHGITPHHRKSFGPVKRIMSDES